MMIWNTFLKFEGQTYNEEGVKHFFEFVFDPKIRQAFEAGRYQMMVAYDNNKKKIVGAGSIRNRNHLSLLFVDENYHLQGIGRNILDKLCTYLKNEEGEASITVNAAPYAHAFYKIYGFEETGSEEIVGGIEYIPMEKKL